MGVSMTRQGDTDQYGVYSYVADTVTDIKTIKTDDILPGSSVLVISPASVYILNTEKEWVKL